MKENGIFWVLESTAKVAYTSQLFYPKDNITDDLIKELLPQVIIQWWTHALELIEGWENIVPWLL